LAPDYFSAVYAEARQRFRVGVAELGWQAECWPVAGVGPDGGDLSVDAGIGPDPRSGKTLVVSCGLHGVEGFFGSAVQLALLEQWRTTPPPGIRIVLLHALNPYGFAWLRRTDSGNVDLNRNFLLPGETYAGAPAGYAELDGVLNPRRPPSVLDPFLLKALPALARHGFSSLRRVVAVGQYEFPRGLFFGGAALSDGAQLIERQLSRLLAGDTHVVHLDLHTGLGRSGEGRLLIDYELTVDQRARLTRRFGAATFQTPDSSAIAYTARGGLGQWCVHSLPPEYLFAYAEFGTYSGLALAAALRAENQAHHWGDASGSAAARAKSRLKDLFCPPDRRWREKAVHGALDLVRRAGVMLQPSGPETGG
jgi:hypothetical protein